ncbi:unnamed protein product [Leptidea sinapis]|uniref:Tetratricopeptide repeat protein 7 N-terminal domain-containing protein n=1 Tax=Leptidea sinapis TaxID=189913 RepID=A0A5E4QYM2_9NEOP|nr:unnamed protein product [Leptidea sinapis]
MTSRSKNAVRSYETEIEKSREESNWKKAVELALQLKARSPQHESLAHFLIGEGKLEAFLDECPPIKDNIERAQRELSEAKGFLNLATDEAGKRAGVALDAHLLLGKLHFACGSYDDSLKHYKHAELNTLTEKELPLRSLRIVAESYAIKGLCLEQTAVPSSTSRFKMVEREAEMIHSFELASDLTLLYLQRATSNVRAGATLETALQRAPLLHIRAGRLASAIDRYREMLTAVESTSTQALRLTLARQLAEVLMRGVTGQVYKAPTKVSPPVQSGGTLSRRREENVSEGPWKPRKYTALNQSAVKFTFKVTRKIYVIVFGAVIAVVVAGSSACGAGVRAVCVARRAAALEPRDVALRLIEESIEFAEEALEIEKENEGFLLARCYLHCGIGYQMKAQKTNCRKEKESANATALSHLLEAVRLDDNDHLAFYHLALQHMYMGMLNEAMDATRACLRVRAECGGGLRLACALWSCAAAGARGARGLDAARLARHHYPGAEWPLWTLAALQSVWESEVGRHCPPGDAYSSYAALATGKELLKLLNSGEEDGEQQYCELDALSDSVHDTHSNRDAGELPPKVVYYSN